MRKEYRKQRVGEKFIKYIRRTWRNKLIATVLVCAGVLGVVVEKDATALVLAMFISIPMFFSNKDWTY